MNESLYLDAAKRISERLDAIDLKLENQADKLSNHITHISMDISAMRTDISWLKNGKKPDDDKTQNADIKWLTWGLRLIIGTLVANALALIFVMYKTL